MKPENQNNKPAADTPETNPNTPPQPDAGGGETLPELDPAEIKMPTEAVSPGRSTGGGGLPAAFLPIVFSVVTIAALGAIGYLLFAEEIRGIVTPEPNTATTTPAPSAEPVATPTPPVAAETPAEPEPQENIDELENELEDLDLEEVDAELEAIDAELEAAL